MLEKRDFYFKEAEDNRPLHIYLPVDYENSQESYPVMYFFDGHNLFRDDYATYGTSWGLSGYLDSIQAKIIIVGMECGHQGNVRLEEYSPYDLENTPVGPIHGRGHATMEWIVNEIKPMIDENYRTLPDRDHTGIGGSSMGGLMSFYGAIAYHDVFSKAACLSSSFLFAPEDVINEIKKGPSLDDSRIYLSFGSHELDENIDSADLWASPLAKIHSQVNEALFIKGAHTYLYMQLNGKHSEAYWRKQNDLLKRAEYHVHISDMGVDECPLTDSEYKTEQPSGCFHLPSQQSSCCSRTEASSSIT